jgi:hypothetical protein
VHGNTIERIINGGWLHENRTGALKKHLKRKKSVWIQTV